MYGKFKKLSDLKKIGVVVVGYFLIKYIIETLNWHRWDSGNLLEGYGNPSKLVLFYWKDCGHCKAMMPEWKKSESQNKTGIKLMKVEKDATDSLGKTLNSKHDISGYPTILLLDDNNEMLEKYEGERKASSILSFLKSK